MHYIIRISVDKWSYNFREIAVKNCKNPKNRRKRLCASFRIYSWGIWKKIYCSSLGPKL